jgi:hypothetical protein
MRTQKNGLTRLKIHAGKEARHEKIIHEINTRNEMLNGKHKKT